LRREQKKESKIERKIKIFPFSGLGYHILKGFLSRRNYE